MCQISLATTSSRNFKSGSVELPNPRRFHFDRSGLRRCNLERFPYHFLYDIRGEYVRVWVLRHDRRNPDFGLDRFSE